jgi:hypothetical protein
MSDIEYIIDYLKNGTTKLTYVTTKKGDIFYTFKCKKPKEGKLKIVLSRALSDESSIMQFVDIKVSNYYTYNRYDDQKEILSYLIPIMQDYLFAGLKLN